MWTKTGAVLAAIVLAGSQATFAGDGKSPEISLLSVKPETGRAGTVYTLTLRIEDPQGPEDIVNVLYQVREKMERIEVPIGDDGLDDDLIRGDGIYTGKTQVPETAARETHRFEVFVKDQAGNKSNILEYRFTVLKEFKI